MSWACITCGADKPSDQYWKQKNKRGHMAERKSCSTNRNKGWVERNRESYRKLNLSATHRYRSDQRQRLLDYARRRAAKKGMEFCLTVDDLEWPSNCPVLGIEMVSRFGSGGNPGGHDDAPSLDRIDNSLGYIPGNVIVVSYRANRMKSDATVPEMQALARFYARLDADKGGQTDMPKVQSQAEKQAGQVPVSNENERGLGVVLPQSGLRVQGRI